MARLNRQQKRYAVTLAAHFRTPSQVADALRERFGLKISRQQAARYDPTTSAGKKLTGDLVELFECERAQLLLRALFPTVPSLGLIRAQFQAEQRRRKLAALHAMSPSRLGELYWGTDSGLPSVVQLARVLGVHHMTLRRRLRAVGITLRTISEQRRIDFRAGRLQTPEAFRRFAWHPPKGLQPPQFKLGCRAKRKSTKRVTLPCWWCGESLTRPPSGVARSARFFHSRRCQGLALAHSRFTPADPRPLLVARLRTLWMSSPLRSRNGPTVSLLEKLGASIGASEAEHFAVIAWWAEEGCVG